MIQPPYLPTAGHVNIGPGGVVEVLGAPFLLGAGGLGHPLELPRTVERLVVRRLTDVVLVDVGFRCHRDTDGMCRFSVNTGFQGVVPFLTCLRIRCQNGKNQTTQIDNLSHYDLGFILMSWFFNRANLRKKS